jgi:hypothetical protein
MQVEVICRACGSRRLMWPSRAKNYKFCTRSCFQAHAPAAEQERFWRRVDKSGDCWLWTAGLNAPGGYGVFRQGGRLPPILAHRFSWEMHFGPVPDEMCVLHDCDVNYPPGDTTNRRCVRPDHLHLGTLAENCHEMAIKGRAHHSKGPRIA